MQKVGGGRNQLLTIENFLRLVKTIRWYCKLLVWSLTIRNNYRTVHNIWTLFVWDHHSSITFRINRLLKCFAGRLSKVYPMPYIIHSQITPKLYILGHKIEKLKSFSMCATGSSHTHLFNVWMLFERYVGNNLKLLTLPIHLKFWFYLWQKTKERN